MKNNELHPQVLTRVAFRSGRAMNFGSVSTRLALALTAIAIMAAQAEAQSRFDSGTARSRSTASRQSAGLWQGSDWLGGASQTAHPEWSLGVRVNPETTGARVISVTPGSAGARARLQPGDVIISVGGYQVGMLNRRLYDLNEELNQRADAEGNVTLLLQDHLSLGLAAVNVRLDSRQQSLTGTLVYRDRSPLPADAMVTVSIENVTRPHYEVRRGQTVFRPNNVIDSRGSIPFEIAFDPDYINPNDVYQVSAYITSAGRTIYNTPQATRVLTAGNPSTASLRLASVYSGRPGTPAITAGYPNYNDMNSRLIQMYRQYLQREPSRLELAALLSTPGIERRLDSMPLEIMAAQEYFDGAGNSNSLWLRRVFKEIVGTDPTQLEFDRWMARYQSLRFSRTELLRQLSMQVKR